MPPTAERWTWFAPLAAVAAALCLSIGTGAAWWWRDEPAPPVAHDGATLVLDRASLARVDLRLVHEELVGDWVVASGGGRGLAWDRLRREAGRDANLGALLDRMGTLVEADPVLNARELFALVRAWNELLDKAGEPWRLAGEVQVGQEGGRWVLKSYRVVYGEGQVAVGDRPFRVELRRRVDRLQQGDPWLGHMHDHQQGVVVSLDRVTTFTLDRVWPLLDPALEPELDDASRRFAPEVRREVAAALGDSLPVLQGTAGDRLRMSRAVREVHQRHACGSAFVVSRLPWSGLSSRDLATLRIHTGRPDEACPEVTAGETLALSDASMHLQGTPGVREALERLVAFVAEAVVVHEARHAGDDAALDGQRIPCVGCPRGTTQVAALESSAYLASFADPERAALALFQACALDPEADPDRADMVAFLADRLLPGGCGAAPDPELAGRARALEQELHLRSDPVRVLAFPVSVPVSTEYVAP